MLYNPYKERLYFWEPVRLLEQLPYIILMSTAWDLPQLTRAMLLLTVAVASTVLVAIVSPFRYPVLRHVEIMSSIATLSLLILLIIMEHGQPSDTAVKVMTVMAGVIMVADIGTYFVFILLRARKDLERSRGVIRKRLSQRRSSARSRSGRTERPQLPALQIADVKGVEGVGGMGLEQGEDEDGGEG